MKYYDIPLPKAWPKQVKSIILHVISLAHWSLIHSRSWAANSPIHRVRLTAERDQALTNLPNLSFLALPAKHAKVRESKM